LRDAAAVQADCALLEKAESAGLGTFTKLGLGGVVATQFWHHLYLGGGLCDLPTATRTTGAQVEPPTESLAVA
jgi:asparagine synthase (glutamine-hydrolysing)